MMELKPCPFCGGTGQYETASGGGIRVAYVKCIQCYAQIAKVPVSDEYCAKDEAIKAWNRRAT